MNVCTISNLTKDQHGQHLVGEWKATPNSIPIYRVDTPHAFNRIVGYAMYINSMSGTVLYRGQNQLYDHLLPSGARRGRTAVSEQVLASIFADKRLAKFFGLCRSEIVGCTEHGYMLIEAVLQHYGANTYCMDFVDNHWCALWFGLYQFDHNHYHMRKDDGSLYIFLYSADTKNPCVGGMYIGNDTYTVDLRKAVPSYFQRPASQHGWVVRPKERIGANLDDRVVGIIEVSVKNARLWLGDGKLLSEENFFPSYTYDQGYEVLLSRQCRSGLSSRNSAILPQNTICNYHMQELFFCSDVEKMLRLRSIIPIPEGISATNPLELFSILLNVGWDENTRRKNTRWDENAPYIGQSAATAILLQRWFGGDIRSIHYASGVHYYNVVDGVIIDLTYRELQDRTVDKYIDSTQYTQVQTGKASAYRTYEERVGRLIENCRR